MLVWFLSFIVIGTDKFGSKPSYGMIFVSIIEIPLIIIPLDFISQPRFVSSIYLEIAGIAILSLALAFGSPVFIIKPFTKPKKLEPLRTHGFYSIIRHPLYFCDVFWPLGFSLIFQSLIGSLLVVFWLIVVYFFAWYEEINLLKAYGSEYEEYKKRVKKRLVPFIL